MCYLGYKYWSIFEIFSSYKKVSRWCSVMSSLKSNLGYPIVYILFMKQKLPYPVPRVVSFILWPERVSMGSLIAYSWGLVYHNLLHKEIVLCTWTNHDPNFDKICLTLLGIKLTHDIKFVWPLRNDKLPKWAIHSTSVASCLSDAKYFHVSLNETLDGWEWVALALESRRPVGWSFHFETLRMPKLAAEKQFSVQIFEKCFSILICGHYMMIIINWFRKKYCWTEHYLPYLLSFPFRNHWGKTIVCHQNHRSMRTYFSLKSFRILASKTNVALLKPTRTIFEETSSISIRKTLLLPSSSNENVKTSETVNTHESGNGKATIDACA